MHSRSRLDLSENEGGNPEIQQRLMDQKRKELEVMPKIVKQAEKVSESSSDITQKAVSEIASGNHISVNEL
jgi:hypothetical protein